MIILNDTVCALERPLDEAVLNGTERHRYAVHLSQTAEALRHIFALQSAGAGVFPIHAEIPSVTAEEMARKAGCTHLVSDAGVKPFDAASSTSGGVLVQMSSGTTGAAKVIARSWASIAEEVASYTAFFGEAAEMTPVIACPVTHSYGLIAGVMASLHRGRVPVIVDNLNPKYLLRRMREVEDPLLYTSPAMLHTLVSFLPEGETLHAAMTSGTVLSTPWFEKIRRKTTHFFQQYGCSEVGCIAINTNLQSATDVGNPLPHLGVSAGSSAEDPEPIVIEQAGRKIATGDLGYFDDTGMLVFVSRWDDVIDMAGFNVFPQDIEHAALQMDGVRDALAFRIEDPLAGHRGGLIFEGRDVSPDALRAWLGTRLAPYQQPQTIQQVAQIPRQANGKTNRRDVARQLQAEGALA